MPSLLIWYFDFVRDDKSITSDSTGTIPRKMEEDPVTGNANGPLGIYMVHFGICSELQHAECFDFEIVQGEAIHRDGRMKVHVAKKDGKPEMVQITGKAVVAFKTEIEI